jgi:hypothetical protein
MEGTIPRFNRAVCGYFTLGVQPIRRRNSNVRGGLLPGGDIPWVSRRTAN